MDNRQSWSWIRSLLVYRNIPWMFHSQIYSSGRSSFCHCKIWIIPKLVDWSESNGLTVYKYPQPVVVLRLNVSKALILWFLSWVNNKTVIIFSYKGYCAMSFIFYVNVVCLFCISYCIWIWNKVLSFNKSNNKLVGLQKYSLNVP
jgi:hypothetical protein